jgi:hypothetical protein
MTQQEKSIECMKQIYEVDYGYRDVAERVEGSYGEAADRFPEPDQHMRGSCSPESMSTTQVPPMRVFIRT